MFKKLYEPTPTWSSAIWTVSYQILFTCIKKLSPGLMESDMPVNSILETSEDFSFLQETTIRKAMNNGMAFFIKGGFVSINIRQYLKRLTGCPHLLICRGTQALS